MTIGDVITTMHSLYFSRYIIVEDKLFKIKHIEDFKYVLRK